MISQQINSHLKPAHDIFIRTIHHIQDFSITIDDKRSFEPDIDMISYIQLPSTFALFSIDDPTFTSHPQYPNFLSQDQKSEFLASLPSANLTTVGIIYEHYKNPVHRFCSNGWGIHTQKVKYKYFRKSSKVSLQELIMVGYQVGA